MREIKFRGRTRNLEEDTVHPMSKWLCKIGSYKLIGNLWDNKDMLDFCKRKLL